MFFSPCNFIVLKNKNKEVPMLYFIELNLQLVNRHSSWKRFKNDILRSIKIQNSEKIGEEKMN